MEENMPQAEITGEAKNHSTAPIWDAQTSLLVGVGFAILLIALAVVFWSVIPLALGTSVIAYLLDPIADFFDKRVTFGRRGLSILLTFSSIIVIIVLIFVMLLPPLGKQAVDSVISLRDSAQRVYTQPQNELQFIINPKPSENEESDEEIAEELQAISLQTYILNFLDEQGFEASSEWLIEAGSNLNFDRQTIQQIFNVGGGVTTSLVGSIFSIAGSTLGLIFNSLFFISILGILLGGADKIPPVLFRAAPDGYEDDARRLLTDLAAVWDAYVRGNFYLGLIMGFAMWVLAIVLGLPNPLFLAFIAFSMEFIPNIGPTISNLAAVSLALVGGSSTFPEMSPFLLAGIIFILWIILQQIEAIILVPRIVGESLKLHPAIVVLSVIWGGSIGGLIGVIIAPPLVASIRIILQYFYGRLTGRAAFVDHDENPPESPFKRIQAFIEWLVTRGEKKKKNAVETSSEEE